MTIRVRFVVDTKARRDGAKVILDFYHDGTCAPTYHAGRSYDLPDEVANTVIQHGAAYKEEDVKTGTSAGLFYRT